MGKKFIDLSKRPRMWQYALCTAEEIEYLEYIQNEVSIPNSILRVPRLFRHKNLAPKYEELWYMPWGEMELMKMELSEGNLYEAINYIWPITKRKFNRLEITNVLACMAWIKSELQKIQDVEAERLNVKMTDQQIEAGADRLSEFGYYVALRSIQPDITKHEETMKLPYNVIFRELLVSSIEKQVKSKYDEIITRNIQRNSGRS